MFFFFSQKDQYPAPPCFVLETVASPFQSFLGLPRIYRKGAWRLASRLPHWTCTLRVESEGRITTNPFQLQKAMQTDSAPEDDCFCGTTLGPPLPLKGCSPSSRFPLPPGPPKSPISPRLPAAGCILSLPWDHSEIPWVLRLEANMARDLADQHGTKQQLHVQRLRDPSLGFLPLIWGVIASASGRLSTGRVRLFPLPCCPFLGKPMPRAAPTTTASTGPEKSGWPRLFGLR